MKKNPAIKKKKLVTPPAKPVKMGMKAYFKSNSTT